jgi:hypothetical protein
MVAPKAARRNYAAANADARIRAPASATATNPGSHRCVRSAGKAVGGSRIPMNTKRFTQIFARQLDWLDISAKIVQQRDRLCDGGSHFSMPGVDAG